MSIHPIVKDFLAQPEVCFDKSILSELDGNPHVSSLASFERVNRLLSGLTTEQKIKCREAAHQYLFGKKTKS